MKSNRVITRAESEVLDLEARIALEARITDEMVEKVRPFSLPPDWTFDRYRNRSPWRRRMFDFLGPLAGRTVLDLGCGYHPTPVFFALAGASKVYACDVSSRAIAYVQSLVEQFGLAERVELAVCPAERLLLEDGSVDLVHGESVLHHLDLPRAGAEIARVLRKGGRATFKDPLGQNRVLEFVRDYVPYAWRHEAKGTDHPLRFEQLEAFGNHFSQSSWRGFGFVSMLATAVVGRRESQLTAALHRVDQRLLQAFPSLERYCRFVVTCVER